jgi:hypothetical protein
MHLARQRGYQRPPQQSSHSQSVTLQETLQGVLAEHLDDTTTVAVSGPLEVSWVIVSDSSSVFEVISSGEKMRKALGFLLTTSVTASDAAM